MNTTRRDLSRLLFAMAAVAPFGIVARAALAADEDDTGLPNTFISPCGKPYRAATGAPYPVVDWFKEVDKNGDGRIDHEEFVADAEAFFAVLDFKKTGILTPVIIAFYEQRVVPEILGAGLPRSAADRSGGRLWLAQYQGQGQPSVPQPGSIDPSGKDLQPTPRKPKDFDESNQGAAPYSFFDEPEPLMAADMDLNGFIKKTNFLKVADMHFTTLDRDEDGYLTLAKLPKTPIEKLLEKSRPRRKKS
jgi:hypothetical protein